MYKDKKREVRFGYPHGGYPLSIPRTPPGGTVFLTFSFPEGFSLEEG
jgi:hypothetical protein